MAQFLLNTAQRFLGFQDMGQGSCEGAKNERPADVSNRCWR